MSLSVDEVEAHALKIWDGLSFIEQSYAIANGGFAALHDLFDANELLEDFADDIPAVNKILEAFDDLAMFATRTLPIRNHNGKPFYVRVVLEGMTEGTGTHVHQYPDWGIDPLVEFWLSPAFRCSQYYLSTLILSVDKQQKGILMDGARPEWSISNINVREAVAYTMGVLNAQKGAAKVGRARTPVLDR